MQILREAGTSSPQFLSPLFKRTYQYIQGVYGTCSRVHEVLGNTDSEEIVGVLKEVRRLSSEGSAIDQEMERLIEEYEASDEEVGYRYRDRNGGQLG